MEVVITFLVTVVGGVVCHLIVKWLDRSDKDNKLPSGCFATIKEKEESPDCVAARSGDFVLCPDGLVTTFFPIGIIAYAVADCNMHFQSVKRTD